MNNSLFKDLSSISKTSDDFFSAATSVICNADLDNFEWSLYLDTLQGEDRSSASSLFRVINWASTSVIEARSYNDAMSDLDGVVKRLANGDQEALNGWEKIKNLLPAVKQYLVNRKEESIKSRFNRVSDFSITIDARPIFSMDRSEIEKVIYPHIVKIVTQDDQEFLCEFYEDQFDLLIEELSLAKKKLEKLKTKFGSV